MSQSRDIILTWPKTKSLIAYRAELAAAAARSHVINYRVAHLPVWEDAVEDHGFRSWPYGTPRPRCYMVHTGYVRGWMQIIGTCWREDGEVEGWPSGWYIVRSPEWHYDLSRPPMESFRGWRWYARA